MRWLEQLEVDGFALLEGVLDGAGVEAARAGCAAALGGAEAQASVLADRSGLAYGARNLLAIWPEAIDLARRSSLALPLMEVLGRDAVLVRALYFDKPPGRSWSLPWHRDMTIAVQRHGAAGIFHKHTTKAGVPHVEAPSGVLAAMLTARLHLDDMTARNGPLKVIPGSHATEDDTPRNPLAIACRAGDVLLMRPLLLHASAQAEPGHDLHRRVVHFEFSSQRTLADGYAWHTAIPLDPAARPS